MAFKIPEIMELYLKVLGKYDNYKGRTGRKEFWTFMLINFVITVILTLLGFLGREFEGFLPVAFYSALSAVATNAAMVRRLHDISKSGWTLLLLLLPVIGVIVVLGLLTLDGDPGTNAYGPVPKQEDEMEEEEEWV